jgi:hypothetical protein
MRRRTTTRDAWEPCVSDPVLRARGMLRYEPNRRYERPARAARSHQGEIVPAPDGRSWPAGGCTYTTSTLTALGPLGASSAS